MSSGRPKSGVEQLLMQQASGPVRASPDSGAIGHSQPISRSAPQYGVPFATLTTLLLICMTAGGLAYVAANFTDLAPDEAQYWDWSRHLEWSYYSKGPMVAYLIAAATRIGGHTELAVRAPAMLLALATAVSLYLLAERLYDSRRAAFLTVLICTACPLFIAGSVLMTTDAPLVFSWVLAVLALHRAVHAPQRNAPGWWTLVGVGLGLGCLTKYSMLLFVPCWIVYVALSPTARRSLRCKGPYLALGVGALLSTPVILWNAQHEWGSLRHVMWQAGLSNGPLALSMKMFSNFIGSQLGVLSPILLIASVSAIVRAGVRAQRQGSDKDSLVFAFSAPPLAAFLAWSLVEKVQGNWAAISYCTAFLALAGWWDELLSRPGAAARRRVLSLQAATLLPGYVTIVLAFFPALVPLLGLNLPARLNPATRLLQGWEELGTEVSRTLEGERSDVFLMSDRYQITSALAFYVTGHPHTYNLDLGRRANQYDVWGGFDQMHGRDGLLVTEGTWDAPPGLEAVCDQVQRLKLLDIERYGQILHRFAIFRCAGFHAAHDLAATHQ